MSSIMQRELNRLNYENEGAAAVPVTDSSGSESAVRERRFLLTKAVADAWERFQTPEKREMVAGSFRKLGMALPIEGLAYCELSIKGIPQEQPLNGIHDWRHGSLETLPSELL